MPVATNVDLERAIVANPYDVDAYRVYSDWLIEQGDLRGELIALQAAGKTKEAKKFLDENVGYFLGPLVDHQKTYDDGLYNNARVNSKDWIAENEQTFLWKNGFIYRLRLAHNQYWTSWKGNLAKDVLAPTLAHPSGKFIVEISINENDDPNETPLDDLIEVIAEHAPPTLRKLRLGDNVDQISWYFVGNLEPIWKGVPSLTHLDIEAGQFDLGEIDAPNLVHAVFKTGGLSKASAQSIAGAHWPMLEHLEVYVGDPQYGGDATLDDILPLLDRDLPRLRYLGIENAEFEADLIEPLAQSKLVKQLHTLDMSKGVLLDEHVERFLAHAKAFRHLEVLDVSETYLSDEAIAKLATVAKTIKAEDRWKDDGEFRFVRVGE